MSLLNPLVSVCIITYNHSKYIEQCLDSILEQKTDFKFELVIGEDKSSDNTFEIISRYAEKFGNIRVLDNSKNLGALPNFVRTLRAAKGKYIAFCEGDDCWIDKEKLKKQVAFLNEHSEYGGVCTNNRWLSEATGESKDRVLPSGKITFAEITLKNTINSQSILFRKSLLSGISWMKELGMGDWPLHHLVCAQKPYYRLGDVMTCYRVHPGGIHSQLNFLQKLKNRKEAQLACLRHLPLRQWQSQLLKEAIKNTLKQLMAMDPEHSSVHRAEYRKLGGSRLNKTYLKSWL